MLDVGNTSTENFIHLKRLFSISFLLIPELVSVRMIYCSSFPFDSIPEQGGSE